MRKREKAGGHLEAKDALNLAKRERIQLAIPGMILKDGGRILGRTQNSAVAVGASLNTTNVKIRHILIAMPLRIILKL